MNEREKNVSSSVGGMKEKIEQHIHFYVSHRSIERPPITRPDALNNDATLPKMLRKRSALGKRFRARPL